MQAAITRTVITKLTTPSAYDTMIAILIPPYAKRKSEIGNVVSRVIYSELLAAHQSTASQSDTGAGFLASNTISHTERNSTGTHGINRR